MLLLFDIGNTNIVVGVHNEQKIIETWRILTDTRKTADEYTMLIKNFLEDINLSFAHITGVIVSSVVPEMQKIIELICDQRIKITPLFVGPGIKTGINIRVDEPKHAGADLIVGAVAVFHKYQGPAIIVDFGTATTITVVTADGDFIGGAIVPGIELASDALFDRAAKLPKFSLDAPPSIIGRSTQHAVQSGLIFGYASLVDGMIERMRLELNAPNCQVITTGGQATIIAKHSNHITIVDSLLLLDGLKILYDLNK
ncbi:type III pantothenate kinase [Erysipelotrichaceae bacterium]|nr:type III pantothenate kinase [Erysipelotrichaceae bacterium]